LINGAPAAIYPVSIPEAGPYSFHVTSAIAPAALWQTYIFLLSDDTDPTTTMICNNNGYGSGAVPQTRSDMSVYLTTPGTYYLVVTGVKPISGSAAYSGQFSVWVLNDNYGFGRWAGNHSSNAGEINNNDALDSLFVSLNLLSGYPEMETLFDVSPAQLLSPASGSAPAEIYPVGDGEVNNVDSLGMLYLQLGLMVIPMGPAASAYTTTPTPPTSGDQPTFYGSDFTPTRASEGCWTGSAWHTDQATTNPSTDGADNTACGADGTTCLNCRAANMYCYNSACVGCNSNTCPHGCCGADGVCYLYASQTGPLNLAQSEPGCGIHGSSCAACPTYYYNGGANSNQSESQQQQIQCLNGVCADCTVTFALTAAENFCAATFAVAYPNTGTSAVAYAGLTNGTTDANFVDYISPTTFSSSTSSLEFQVETNNAPNGTSGSGNFAVLHFSGTTSTPPVAVYNTPVPLLPLSTAVDGFTVSIPSGDSYPFIDCSIPPNGEYLAGDYTVTLSCPDYTNDH
jgi:hypothetical protein